MSFFSARTRRLRSAGASYLGVLLASSALAGCGREALLPGAVGGGGGGDGGSGGAGGCEPETETCNGVDDNCNGQVDEGCACQNGDEQQCYSGPPDTAGVGPCTFGLQTCENGGWGACNGDALPSPEACDGIDNDCNGQVDDIEGAPCKLGLAGACSEGATKCVNGAAVCSQIVFSQPETCDGIDNDCNGQIDDLPGTCSTGLSGACAMGTPVCSDDGQTCVPAVKPEPEKCDGLDHDCDGDVPIVFFSETFANANTGWSLEGEWAIGPAMASMPGGFGNPDPSEDHTPTDDNGVAGVVLGGTATTMMHPFTWLTSPIIAVDPTAGSVHLRFYRWLNSDYAPWMTNRVEVKTAPNGAWDTVWDSGGPPGVQDAAWTKQAFDITKYAMTGQLQVRFGFDVAQQGAFTVSSWNVDDIVVASAPCD